MSQSVDLTRELSQILSKYIKNTLEEAIEVRSDYFLSGTSNDINDLHVEKDLEKIIEYLVETTINF